MKKILGIILVLVFVISVFVGCGDKYTCDTCGKKFSGTAYYDGNDYNTTLCKDCAVKYFAPLPINNWAKTK